MNRWRSLLFLLIVTGLVATPARSTDLTINFTGTWKNGTCNFTVPDTDLGTYDATYFTGSTLSPWKVFTVTRSNCTSDIRVVHMKFGGTADSNNSSYFGIKSATGNVTALAIQIMNLSNQNAVPNSTVFDWDYAANTYQFQARLAQTRPSVTAGTVKTPITIQITYN